MAIMAPFLSVWHGIMPVPIALEMAVEDPAWVSKGLPPSIAGPTTPALTKLAACYVSLHPTFDS